MLSSPPNTFLLLKGEPVQTKGHDWLVSCSSFSPSSCHYSCFLQSWARKQKIKFSSSWINYILGSHSLCSWWETLSFLFDGCSVNFSEIIFRELSLPPLHVAAQPSPRPSSSAPSLCSFKYPVILLVTSPIVWLQTDSPLQGPHWDPGKHSLVLSAIRSAALTEDNSLLLFLTRHEKL